MALPGRRAWALPSLCFFLVVLICSGEGTPRPPVEIESPVAEPDTTGPWSVIRAKVAGLVEPVVSKTQEKWRNFWSPGPFQGYVQTYYEDHLKDLGPRARSWLRSSKEKVLNKAHSLCPTLLCGDGDADSQ
ncbi:apolipoprotein C-IV [Suncus etruscus]|uniref:apolipoprotein C-IV n=1 Tax=Suncus etruscus TaxID=109475 RepID=UPI0021104B4D|nr:apolipoprotein C-IV [Suncus etruscus]